MFFHPRRELSEGEWMVASKARSGLKQHMRDRPTKWGCKLFVLADSSNGYTCNFLFMRREMPWAFCHATPWFFIYGGGYRIYMDSFYTSPSLFIDHLQDRTMACGTISYKSARLSRNDSKRSSRECRERYHPLVQTWLVTHCEVEGRYRGHPLLNNSLGLCRWQSIKGLKVMREFGEKNLCQSLQRSKSTRRRTWGGMDLSDGLFNHHLMQQLGGGYVNCGNRQEKSLNSCLLHQV